MVENVFQVIVIVVLAFVLIFGIGFILNMLMKTTWVPIYAYAAVIAALFVYFEWGSENLLAGILSYGVIDWLAVAAGLAGAYASGVVIRTLRSRGYKMF